MRYSLIALLENRFGSVPVALQERIDNERSLARLQEWVHLASTAGSLEEFERTL